MPVPPHSPLTQEGGRQHLRNMAEDEIICCHKTQMLFLFEHTTCIKKEVECQSWSGIWLEKSEPVFKILSLISKSLS